MSRGRLLLASQTGGAVGAVVPVTSAFRPRTAAVRRRKGVTTGRPYQTSLDPPPGPPADAEGNFLPLPQWLPGQPQPPDWPPHIHPPKECVS